MIIAFIPVFEKGAAALKNPKVKNLVQKLLVFLIHSTMLISNKLFKKKMIWVNTI